MDRNQGPVWESLADILRHIAEEHKEEPDKPESTANPNPVKPLAPAQPSPGHARTGLSD